MSWLFSVALVMALSVTCLSVSAGVRHQSSHLRVETLADDAGLVFLGVDSLGKGRLDANLLREASPAPGWRISVGDRRIVLRSRFGSGAPAKSYRLTFNPRVCHATLLGHMNEDGGVTLPALLHLPDYGTFRITAKGTSRPLPYDAHRDAAHRQNSFVRVELPPPAAASPEVEYQFEVVSVYPKLKGIEQDRRFDGFRRNFLNVFQLNPRLAVLANHAASDSCAFTLFIYSTHAAHTPSLAPGLTAMDLIRETLDRYLAGKLAYGMVGYRAAEMNQVQHDFLDTYPSLLIAASDYVTATGDREWLRRNYAGLQRWLSRMSAMDRDGNGLIEYPLSRNAGSWPRPLTVRPANWWDTIGFGHEDAYSNALAYRAYQGMEKIARMLGEAADANACAAKATTLRQAYYKTFYNPDTGVLAGWRSADGALHDYYFTFVNSMAIHYGLVDRDSAHRIMDRLLAKMREVGFTRFDLGIPGNLIPIRRADYVEHRKRYGGPEREDGSDAFQIYENGGATACYAYYTMQVLYDLGRYSEGDAILLPMLQAFEDGQFQGFGANGNSKDWKAWDGTPWGYEGFLVDNYLSLLAVVTRGPAPFLNQRGDEHS